MNNTLQTLQRKRKSQKGFTLMEMLIVVAIIAILVAISIPVFSAQLDTARKNTDAANERAAKAVAVASYLTNETTGTKYYNAQEGTLVNSEPTTGYGQATGHKNEIIKIEIATDGTPTVTWVAKGK